MKLGRPARIRVVTSVSFFTYLAYLLFFIGVGIIMRLNQGANINISATNFYAMMTAHGLGMVATLFSASFVAIWYLLNRYVSMSIRLMWVVYFMNFIGFIGLLSSTLVAKFGAGWYLLYPLPFLDTWPYTSIGLIIYTLIFWGVAWLLLLLDMLRAMSQKYGVENLMGWQYFKKRGNITEIPPMMIIVTISCIAGIVAIFSGANMLILYLFKWNNLTWEVANQGLVEVQLDPLLLKNMVFLFGHTIVNITMYFGIAFIYELLPTFSKRPWKTNTAVVISWNFAVILVLGAFLHHLSMDFAQSIPLQFIGQISSYYSAVPATVVTIFGVVAQFYKSDLKLSFTPLAFALGVLGWLIGGLAAVIDSTIAINQLFHNTMWVPAHFHTYFLVGLVLMILGFVNYYSRLGFDGTLPTSEVENSGHDGLNKFSLWTMIIGGYGFVIMFYIGGVAGVPRRFAEYSFVPLETVKKMGQTTASWASFFAIIFFVGISLYFLGFLGSRKATTER